MVTNLRVQEAQRIHAEAIVFDGHYDVLYDTLDEYSYDLQKLRSAGVTAHVRTSWDYDILQFFERSHQFVEERPSDLCIATKATHIRLAKQEGQVATVLSLEGAEALEHRVRYLSKPQSEGSMLTMLKLFYRLGLRSLGLTWHNRNWAADGVRELRSGGGLTELGVGLVTAMDRLGIMLDIAHLAPAGVKEVFDYYGRPVVASHANARALCQHPRNLSDEQLELVAASGGLVGVTPVPMFISDRPEDASLEKFLDHVDHVVATAGIECVGIGTDWVDPNEQASWSSSTPPYYFMKDITDLPRITDGLLQRRYSKGDIRKILGENWLRVFEEVTE